tara:strand:+ start:416 stop:871 length:456 start_codon:yes stop_codon:yes gene_type:complete
MQIKGLRFLVIGGAGFIGSHLVYQLFDQGAELVKVYDNFSRGSLGTLSKAKENPKCKIFGLDEDMRDRHILFKAIEGVDGVFRLAALWLLHCVEFPRNAFHTLIEGMFNVLEAWINSNVNCVEEVANSIGFQANINLESGLNQLLKWKRLV